MNQRAFILCTDKNYAAHAGTCIFSILLSTAARDFDIHLLAVSLTNEDHDKFHFLSKAFNVPILIHDASEHLRSLQNKTSKLNLCEGKHFSDTTLLRLAYTDVLDQHYDRLAYVDCDVIFQHDAHLLLDQDLSGYPLAACLDFMASRNDQPDVSVDFKYFNAGILLIDDRKWRDLGIDEKLLEIMMRTEKNERKYADQDILNLHFRRHGYAQIPFAFNDQYMATVQAILAPTQCSLDAAVAIHYAGEIKPWHEWASRPYADIDTRYRQ